jgi:hypothetical protein
MSTNLRYRVQSNAFVMDKSKEIKNQSFTKIFAVRRHDMHDKDKFLSCVTLWRTAKANDC